MFTSIFFREKGSAVPSLVDNEVEFCRLTKLFSFLPLSNASYESEKNPTLAEIRTRELAARSFRGRQLETTRGDRLLWQCKS